jgi:hypothetical protein
MPGSFREVGTDPGDLNDCNDLCLATGIGASFIPENLNILRVCQDPDNLGIIYMEVVLSGVFDYTPKLEIDYIDQFGVARTVDVSASFIPSYKGSSQSPSSLPILTECGTVELLLAWTVSHHIANFASLATMNCRLQVVGVLTANNFDPELIAKLQETSSIFTSVDPQDEIELVKGVTPVPYALYFDDVSGQLKLQYSGLGSGPCFCDIDCVDFSVSGQELVVCDDEIQEVTVDLNSIVGDPTKISLTFTDVVGNVTPINVQVVSKVVPRAPETFWRNDPLHVQVIPYYITVNDFKLEKEKVQYQIWKYVDTTDSPVLLQDWTTKQWSTYFDTEVENGRTYGYAVVFRGEFKEVSDISAWSVITVPSA